MSSATASTTAQDSETADASSLARVGDIASRSAQSTGEQLAQQTARILASDRFAYHLFLMERIVNMNLCQPKLARYRGLPEFEMPVMEIAAGEPGTERATRASDRHSATERGDESDAAAGGDAASAVAKKSTTQSTLGGGAAGQRPQKPLEAVFEGPALERLWTFSLPDAKGLSVTSIAWNRRNADLFAVGYGQLEFSVSKPGLVACWSLKNLQYPERLYRLPSGVTALDFSGAVACLLAFGLHDGSVGVINVKSKENKTLLDNTFAPINR